MQDARIADTKRTLTRREFLTLTMRSALITSVIGVGGTGYIRGFEPGWIDIQSVRLSLPRLSPQFHGYRILQISDIHIDNDWMTQTRLTELVTLANSQQADLIVLTGDFVSLISDAIAADLVMSLRQAHAKDGVLAILGNHDHWTDAGKVRETIKASAIIDVNNDVFTLERNGALLHIAGVDDIWVRKQRLDLVLEKLPAEGAAVLLAHEPDFADTSAATGRFDLQISGHSHGGQIDLPFLGALRLPYLGEKYYRGLYQVGSMLQYTNRGVGMLRPYVRFNCRPEITLFTLNSPKRA